MEIPMTTRQDRDGKRKFSVTYKDTKTLKRFLSDDGKILPRRRTGLSAKNQRKVTLAVKRARHLALLPYSTRE